jgi:hypothetical protein
MSIHIKTHQPDQSSKALRRVDLADLTSKPMLPVRIYQRIRQFVRGLGAQVKADEMLIASDVLPKSALARFCQMPLDAQRHSLNVLYTLHEAKWDDSDLAVAALLHDVGKIAGQESGVNFTPWLRGPLVLMDALTPDLMLRLAADDPSLGWRYLLHVHREHPAIGAAWATEDECSELSCWLIAHHQDKLTAPPSDFREELLVMLQWADRCN